MRPHASPQVRGRHSLLILLDTGEPDFDHAQPLRIREHLCHCVILGKFVRMKVNFGLGAELLLPLGVEIRIERIEIHGLAVPGDRAVELDGECLPSQNRRRLGERSSPDLGDSPVGLTLVKTP